MNNAQKTNRFTIRLLVLSGSALLMGATSVLSNEPILVTDAGDTGTASRAPTTAKPAKDADLADLPLDQLLNVEITTASKSEEKQSDAPGVVSVVTKDELRRFGGTTLKDILERVPGLIGSTVYMTDRSMIAVRGDQVSNSGEHVLLLINGRPVREVQEGGIKSEMLETFPVDIIERIEVVKGPGSVLYGTSAFSGVINVITEKPEKNGISVTGLGGEEGAYGAMGDWRFKSGDFSLIAAGRYFEKADWPVNYVAAIPGGGGTVTDHITVPNKGTGAYLGANYNDFSLMAAYNEWETAYFIPDYMWLFDALGISRWQKIFSNLGYDTEVNDVWRTSANVTCTQSRFKTTSWPNVERNSHEVVGEWANFITLSEKSKLILGGLISEIRGKESDTTTTNVWSEGDRLDYGFYAQADYLLLDNLKVIGGAQANKIENLDWSFVPRGGVVWYPVPRINVKVLYGQAFRAPSINETSLDHPGLRGNPSLKPEKVGTIDLGVNYQGEQTQFGVNLFRSELTDIIYQDRSGFPTYANRNDTITIEGIELEGKWYATKTLFLTGSTLYQTSKDESGNNNLSPIANFGAKAGISYVSENGLTLSLFDIYQGPLDDQYDAQLNHSPGAYNKLNLHFELNLKKFFHWKIGPGSSLIVRVDNLLDEQIWLPNWGLTPGQSIPYEKGRAIYAGLNVKF